MFEQLSGVGLSLKKGEFETTKDFERRKSEALARADLPYAFLVRGTYDSNQVQYDADHGRFIVKEIAWNSEAVDWSAALMRPPTNRRVGLSSRENSTRIGAARPRGQLFPAGVTKIERETYGVYDPDDSTIERLRPTWRFDSFEQETMEPVVYVSVPIEEAQRIKESLQVGVEFLPREPYTAEGNHRHKANFRGPTDIRENVHVIFGDIICTILADPSGRVLRTVSVSPR